MPALAREPGLARRDLEGAGVYWDARVRDARLVVETVADARRAGATVASYCTVAGLEPWKMGWVADVEDRCDGSRFDLRGRAWVNATGPWTDRIRRMAAPDLPPLLSPTKGVHVVVSRDALPLRDPTALFAPDGRLVFAVPEGAWTYIGTTDTVDGRDVDDLECSEADVAYLIEAADAALELPLNGGAVVGAWAGWRPLVREEGADRPAAISRAEIVETTGPGLWSVAGGKLTTYRAMAEEVLDRVVESVGWNVSPCVTAERPLVPAALGGAGPPPGASAAAVARVRELFGPDADDVFVRWAADPGAAEPLGEGFPYTAAEVDRAAREMVETLDDLIDRRLLALPEGVPLARGTLERVAETAAPVLGWDDARRQAEVERFRERTGTWPARPPAARSDDASGRDTTRGARDHGSRTTSSNGV